MSLQILRVETAVTYIHINNGYITGSVLNYFKLTTQPTWFQYMNFMFNMKFMYWNSVG